MLTITVDDTGAVQSVRLKQDWKSSVDPRSLDVHVQEALAAATMQAMAKQIELVDMTGEATPPRPAPSSPRDDGVSPITPREIFGLVQEVRSELDRYIRSE